MEESIVFSYT